MYSSNTQFFANQTCLDDADKKAVIDDMLVLMNGVLNGRKRVLLEMNCDESNIDSVVNLLPAMRSPTVAKLYNSADFAIRAAIKKNQVKALIPQLIKAGAIDILEIPIRKAI